MIKRFEQLNKVRLPQTDDFNKKLNELLTEMIKIEYDESIG